MLAFRSLSVLFSFLFPPVSFLIANYIPRLKTRKMDQSDVTLMVVRPLTMSPLLLPLAFFLFCWPDPCFAWSSTVPNAYLLWKSMIYILNSLRKCKLRQPNFGFLVSSFVPLSSCLFSSRWAASIIFIAQSLSFQPFFSFNSPPPLPQVQCHEATLPTLIFL